ncbi:MAG: nuclear transport factor 2 family protein [Deltaproteobacteria bacterium]|nr:nuclear transport factor 2 family protein [Deltaproteobacteria bacterium]
MTRWVHDLFATIDAMQADQFVMFLTEDAQFTFGNGAPVVGRAAIRDAVAAFFDTIKGLRHEITGVWEVGETVICQLAITYTRHDNRVVSVPAANIFSVRDARVHAYRIYIDLSPVYA